MSIPCSSAMAGIWTLARQRAWRVSTAHASPEVGRRRAAGSVFVGVEGAGSRPPEKEVPPPPGLEGDVAIILGGLQGRPSVTFGTRQSRCLHAYPVPAAAARVSRPRPPPPRTGPAWRDRCSSPYRRSILLPADRSETAAARQ